MPVFGVPGVAVPDESVVPVVPVVEFVPDVVPVEPVVLEVSVVPVELVLLVLVILPLSAPTEVFVVPVVLVVPVSVVPVVWAYAPLTATNAKTKVATKILLIYLFIMIYSFTTNHGDLSLKNRKIVSCYTSA
jgi:hypothetical protein